MGVLDANIEEARERMYALYGENHRITDGKYDKSLAVRCINGTFVGRRPSLEGAGGYCPG